MRSLAIQPRLEHAVLRPQKAEARSTGTLVVDRNEHLRSERISHLFELVLAYWPPRFSRYLPAPADFSRPHKVVTLCRYNRLTSVPARPTWLVLAASAGHPVMMPAVNDIQDGGPTLWPTVASDASLIHSMHHNAKNVRSANRSQPGDSTQPGAPTDRRYQWGIVESRGHEVMFVIASTPTDGGPHDASDAICSGDCCTDR